MGSWRRVRAFRVRRLSRAAAQAGAWFSGSLRWNPAWTAGVPRALGQLQTAARWLGRARHRLVAPRMPSPLASPANQAPACAAAGGVVACVGGKGRPLCDVCRLSLAAIASAEGGLPTTAWVLPPSAAYSRQSTAYDGVRAPDASAIRVESRWRAPMRTALSAAAFKK